MIYYSFMTTYRSVSFLNITMSIQNKKSQSKFDKSGIVLLQHHLTCVWNKYHNFIPIKELSQ